MRFTKDSFKRITPPEIVLCKASGERIGIIKTTAFTYDEALNDLNTITFTTYLNIDNERNPYYDQIQEMMYIEFPKTERFVITNIDTESEGTIVEHKQVTAKSYEWMLSTRYLEEFYINLGLPESIDNIDFRHLLHLCIDELFPEWNIGAIHGNLPTMQRSFEVSKSTVYDFLMNDVANAFDCVFEFNSYDKTIDVYPKDMYGENAGVMISYENLLKHAATTLDIGQIKTSLVITGGDDVNIREVARGSDRIYNFSFYNSEEYMSQSLYEAYNRWQNLTYETPVNWTTVKNLTYVDSSGVTRPYFVFDNKTDLDGNYIMNFMTIQTDYQSFLRRNNYQDNYNNLYSFLLNTYHKYFTDVSEWTSSNIPAGNNRRYFGYGDYPQGYPNNTNQESTETFNIERYSAVQRVSRLPSTGDSGTLYLVDDGSYGMYRRYNNKWIDTNIWLVDSSTYPLYIALNPLKEKLKSAENNQANAMKKGYGSETPPDETSGKASEYRDNYIRYYLPYYYSVEKLKATIKTVQDKLDLATECQTRWSTAMTGISNMLSMANNFTIAQFKELSTFIREEELSSENYVVTDVMTEEERFEMLNALYEYGNTELKRISQPQLTFTADIINLFNLPEFDRYSGYVVPGNYIMISLRDDYYIKPCITNIHYNFYDENDFSVTFSNVLKKGRDFYSDIQDALNEANSINNSVSFNMSYWSQQSRNADTITQHLAAGLLAAGEYLANGDDSELVMDSRGLFITTVEGDKKYLDSIFIGGGRILFTEDNWKTVKMSVGRGWVKMPYFSSGSIQFKEQSKFGVFADFVMAGYVAGSIIVGGDIYSANYTTSSLVASGNRGAHIDLTNGQFEFNSSDGSGKKRLLLNGNALTMYGEILASSGRIGCDDNGEGGFIIDSATLRYGKEKWDDGAEGFFLDKDYISFGANKVFYITSKGFIYATKGEIAGFNITTSSIYNNKSSLHPTMGSEKDVEGVYIGTSGIGLGKTYDYKTVTGSATNQYHATFEVTSAGKLWCQGAVVSGRIIATSGKIGGFTITSSSIYNGKTQLHPTPGSADDTAGVIISTSGIGLGKSYDYKTDTGSATNQYHATFEVTSAGKLWCKGAVVAGTIYASSGKIGGFTITSSSLYNTKSALRNNSNGVYIGTNGIGLGKLVTYKYNSSGNKVDTVRSTFEVEKDGTLWCKNLIVQGNIIWSESIKGNSVYDDIDEIWSWVGRCEDNIFGAGNGSGISKALKQLAENFRLLFQQWKSPTAPGFQPIPYVWNFDTGEATDWQSCVG